MTIGQPNLEHSNKLRATLIAGETRLLAWVCHALSSDRLHIEPVGATQDLTSEDCEHSDAILVWAATDSIRGVHAHIARLGKWAPLIGLAESPSVSDVVEAMQSGAADFLSWPCSPIKVLAAVDRSRNHGATLARSRKRLRAARARLARLTKREFEVLCGMAYGLSSKEIAKELRISYRTVEVHRASMLHRLEATSTADAIRWFIEADAVSDVISSHEHWFNPWLFDALVVADPDFRVLHRQMTS